MSAYDGSALGIKLYGRIRAWMKAPRGRALSEMFIVKSEPGDIWQDGYGNVWWEIVATPKSLCADGHCNPPPPSELDEARAEIEKLRAQLESLRESWPQAR